MKNKLITVVIGLVTLTGITVFYDTISLSDTEIKEHIKTALIAGCKPIVDACVTTSEIDIVVNGKIIRHIPAEECINQPVYFGNPQCLSNNIMRTDNKRMQDLYIELGKDLGVKDFNLEKLPDNIRAELEKTGNKLSPIKEDLIDKI